MRMIFGVMSLLMALAIVGVLGKTQLQALGQTGATTTRVPAEGMADAALAPLEASVPAQAQSIQNNVRNATHAALQKGVDRSNAAQP
ncbi:MAG: hypothetical protein Q8L49_10685 [Burkholderiaceae bacterium]|nr:hypothetical protein [Burkholderiaceae bacterium]